jgi:penicillin-binding protein 1A
VAAAAPPAAGPGVVAPTAPPATAPPAGTQLTPGRPVARGPRPGPRPGGKAPARFGGNGNGGNGGNGTRGPGPGRRGGRHRVKKTSFVWRYRRVWFLFGIVVVTALAGAAWVLTQVPLPPEAALPQTTIIYDAAGNQLATLHGQENRFPVKLDQVPDVVQKAVIAAEDRKFFQHGGIDPLGIVRATWADVRHKGATQGGSTITQQYVKQVYVGSDPTLWRKLREAVIAIKLERKLDKRQILERYLNTVYFGRGAYGIQAASRTWFDKDVSQLGLKEASYLVGLIRSPSGGDLVADHDLAYELRRFVLQAMVETKAIPPAQMAEVEGIKLESYVAPRTEIDSEVALPGIGAEYYVQYVRQQLEKTYSEDFVLRQGLRVQTSLDPELQRQAYDAVYGLLDEPGDPAGALVAINQDGQVVAMVGGKDWNQSEVNLAVGDEGGGSGRQGGSTFKPFALAEAVREGYSLESSFAGPAKIVLPKADKGNDWEVTNYEGVGYGQVNLIDATVNSVNTVYAQLVDSLGPDKVVDMAKELGITSELAPVASIALGTQNVSVLEMANAYSTLARGGVRYQPQVITQVSMADTVLPDTRPKGVRVLEKSQADQVNFALEQVVARGSGTGAQVRNTKVKGKTGTTEDFGDAWFVGSTRSLTVAVWMGYPEGQSQQLLNVHGVKKVNGGSLPTKIFQRFIAGLPPENDDTPTATPDFEGRALSPIIRYTTPSATVPDPDPEPAPAAVSDGTVTLSGPTTTVEPSTDTGGPAQATSNGDASPSANTDSQATVDTTPATTKPPKPNFTQPTFTLPPGFPGG